MTDIKTIQQRFKSSIIRGTGEAHLLMLENPGVDFYSSIIKASIKNYAYDGQCESSRAEYLFEFISRSSKKGEIRKAILKALATDQKDTWTLTQLLDLAKIFALEGDHEAKQSIYHRFLNNPSPRASWAGISEIIELDGLDGLIVIANKIGSVLAEDPDDWQDYYYIKRFQENNPNIKVMEELEKEAESNPFIDLFLKDVKLNQAENKVYKRETIIYDNVIEEVLLIKKMQFIHRKFDSDELNLIAQRLIIEKNSNKLEKLLNIFTKNKFPLDSGFILNLAANGHKRRNKISEIAINALQFLEGENIRNFALEQMERSKCPEKFTIILRANYKKGDDKLLTELASKIKNEHALELLMINYLAIYETNWTKDCRGPLEAIYEKSTCGIHRTDLVGTLIENNALSEKLKNEIQFDCHPETRKLYHSIRPNGASKNAT